MRNSTTTPITALTKGWTTLHLCGSKGVASCLDALSVSAVQRGLLGTSLIAFGAFTPAFLPQPNPLLSHEITSLAQQWPGKAIWTAVLLVGVALLLDAWLRLRPTGNAPRADMRAALALWSLPLLPVPPLFSNDAYSYAAQGHMVHVGVDPYSYGPLTIPGNFAPQVDVFWKETPAPYGPLGLQIQHVVVDLCGHSPFLSAVAMRIPALLAVALLAAVVPPIARRLGTDPDFALWIALLNPLVVMHVVGGAHNDAIMIAFMATAILAALRHQFILACVLTGIAAAVKQPAVLLIAPIAAIWANSRTITDPIGFVSYRNELRHQPRLMAYGVLSAICVITSFVVVSIATGLGFGWIDALSVPGEVRTPLAPSTMIGGLTEFLLGHVGLTELSYQAFAAVRAGFSVVGLGLLIWLWARYGRTAPVWFAAWALITMALCGPALHAWYLLWGGTLLACCPLGASVLRTVVWTSAGLVSYSAIDASFRNGSLALGVTAVLAVLWLATGHDADLNRAHDARLRTDADLTRQGTAQTQGAAGECAEDCSIEDGHDNSVPNQPTTVGVPAAGAVNSDSSPAGVGSTAS